MTKHFPLTSAHIAEALKLFKTVVVPVMAAEHAEEDGRAGAVLDLRDKLDNVLLLTLAGSAPTVKFDEYRANARGKNDALEADPNIMTSWEVHQGDLSKPPYPGSIRTSYDDRFSISGFTWQRDTVGSLWLAYQLGRIGIADASGRAALCGIRPQFIQTVRKLNRARDLATAA